MTSKYLLLFGVTNSGKSSFANTLGSKNLAEVGDGCGLSTTKDVSIHTLVKFCEKDTLHLIDTPGLDDTSEKLTNRMIREKIEDLLLDTLTTQLDAILVFQSLNNDYCTFKKSIAQLRQLFGENVDKSIIVLFTKETNKSSRKQRYESICSEVGVPYVYWENSYLDDDDHFQISGEQLKYQTDNLLAAMTAVGTYRLVNLVSRVEQIRRRADELYNAQPEMQEEHPVEISREDGIREIMSSAANLAFAETKEDRREAAGCLLGRVLMAGALSQHHAFSRQNTRLSGRESKPLIAKNVKIAKPREYSEFLEQAKREAREATRNLSH